MLRLCTSDNLGIRYMLIHIYVRLEEEKAAQKFFKKCGEEWGTRFPLSMALLFYKIGKEVEARQYLQMLLDNNKDTKKFFSGYGTSKMESYISQMRSYAYRPNTMEELLLIFTDHAYAYEDVHAFFFWAKAALRSMKRNVARR